MLVAALIKMTKTQKFNLVLYYRIKPEYVMLVFALFVLHIYNVFTLVESQNADSKYYNNLFKNKFSDYKSLKDFASDNVRAEFANVNSVNNSNLNMWKLTYVNEEYPHLLNQFKTTLNTKLVPHSYQTKTKKKIPFYFRMPVGTSYHTILSKPFGVQMEKPFNYSAKMLMPRVYPVQNTISVPINVFVEKKIPVFIPKSYQIYNEQTAVDLSTPDQMKIPYEQVRNVYVSVEKKIPYDMEKQSSYSMFVSPDRIKPVQMRNPRLAQNEISVSYPIENTVYRMLIPIQRLVDISIPLQMQKSNPIFKPVQEYQYEKSMDESNPSFLNGYQQDTISHFITPMTLLKNHIFENGSTIKTTNFENKVQMQERQLQPNLYKIDSGLSKWTTIQPSTEIPPVDLKNSLNSPIDHR